MTNGIIAGTLLSFWLWAILFMFSPEHFGEMFKRFDDARYTMQCD